MADIPDALPDDLGKQTVDKLMNTLQGFCNESKVTRAEIIGALAAVQYALLASWGREDDDG